VNERTKHVLRPLVSGVVLVGGTTAVRLARGLSLRPYLPYGICFSAFFLAMTYYAWWYYGDSPKAVALRAKGEEKRLRETKL
jgi:hypothetical protein